MIFYKASRCMLVRATVLTRPRWIHHEITLGSNPTFKTTLELSKYMKLNTIWSIEQGVYLDTILLWHDPFRVMSRRYRVRPLSDRDEMTLSLYKGINTQRLATRNYVYKRESYLANPKPTRTSRYLRGNTRWVTARPTSRSRRRKKRRQDTWRPNFLTFKF